MAIIVAFCFNSNSHCSIIPSIIAAHPLITPDKMASTVFVPIAFGEFAASILGNFDVNLFNVFKWSHHIRLPEFNNSHNYEKIVIKEIIKQTEIEAEEIVKKAINNNKEI